MTEIAIGFLYHVVEMAILPLFFVGFFFSLAYGAFGKGGR